MKLSKLSRMVYPHKMPSPRGLLLRAAVLAAFFGFCHLAGWRAATTALSGTDPSAAGSTLTIGRGLLYVLAYLGFTVAVPILVLSAAGLRLIEAGVARRRLSIATPGQKILPRTAVVVTEEYVEARIYVDLPSQNGLIGIPSTFSLQYWPEAWSTFCVGSPCQ